MTKDLSLPFDSIGMTIELAADGLQLRFRNGNLIISDLVTAPRLYQVLQHTAQQIKAGETVVNALAQARQQITAYGFRIDYLELRRACDLAPAKPTDQKLVLLVAAFLGSTRLIDNLQFSR